MFTDIHTHAFHPKIARHAVEHLNEAYQLDCVGEGTIADLLLAGKAFRHRPLCGAVRGHHAGAGRPGQ